MLNREKLENLETLFQQQHENVMEKKGADKTAKSDDVKREGKSAEKRRKKGKSSESSKSTLNQQRASSGDVHSNFWFTWLVGGALVGSLQLLRNL